MYYVCIVDFKTTYSQNSKNDKINEIIVFSSILYKIENKIEKSTVSLISEFKKYIKPSLNPILSDICIEFSGINQYDIDNADSFNIVYKSHCDWMTLNIPENEKIVFITYGKWNLSTMLPIEIKRHNLQIHDYHTKYTDLKHEFSKKFGVSSNEMINILNKLKSDDQKFNDCHNLAKIVVKMIENKHTF